jgi:DNA-binding transcriptional LysR family regulator
MRDMELRHLRYFVAVAEELNFHRAADRLHVAQSAISEQVRRLEQELGVQLFDRTQRGVSLTDPGVALLREARRVLNGAAVAQLAAKNARDGATSTLRIGYMPASLPGSVPRALGRLSISMPRLDAALEPGNSFELIEGVRAGEFDAAIVSLPAPTNGLRVTPLSDQCAVAVLPAGHQQAMKSVIRLEQVAPERIVVLPREANRPFYDAVLATCHNAGMSPRFVEMPDANIDRTLLAVASGTAMALLPDSVPERYAALGVRFARLHGASPSCATAVVTRRDTPHVLTAAFLCAVVRTDKLHAVVLSAAAVPAVA